MTTKPQKENPKPSAEQPQATENSPKTCFIVTPIGDVNSSVRKATEGLLDAVICPVCEEFNYEAKAVHQISFSGSITKKIIEQLLNADLVIANLTGLNPNVMYELAVRHAAAKPVIPIAEFGTSLPFDIQAEKTIFYENSMHGAVQLREELKKQIKHHEEHGWENTDNLIYSTVQDSIIKQNIQPGDQLSYVVDRLDSLEERILATQKLSGPTRRTRSTLDEKLFGALAGSPKYLIAIEGKAREEVTRANVRHGISNLFPNAELEFRRENVYINFEQGKEFYDQIKIDLLENLIDISNVITKY